jgi:hypothetical protein
MTRVVMLGLLLGLIVAGGIAFFRSRMDIASHRFAGPDDEAPFTMQMHVAAGKDIVVSSSTNANSTSGHCDGPNYILPQSSRCFSVPEFNLTTTAQREVLHVMYVGPEGSGHVGSASDYVT